MPIRCLQSRYASATVFSFYGQKHEVCWLLQKLSHRTRAYIVNSNGLQGFVHEFTLPSFLDSLQTRLDSISCHQIIKVNSVKKELKRFSSSNEKECFLMEHYPAVFILSFVHLKRSQELLQYSEYCRALQTGDPGEYSLYIHGFLLPWLEQ